MPRRDTNSAASGFAKAYHFATGPRVKNGTQSALNPGEADVRSGSQTDICRRKISPLSFGPSASCQQRLALAQRKTLSGLPSTTNFSAVSVRFGSGPGAAIVATVAMRATTLQ